MQRIDENTYIDDTLVTCAEYQLFIDEMREQGKYYQPDHWTSYQFPEGQAHEPILGVRHSDAVAFCEWLTSREGKDWRFRLPTQKEANAYPIKHVWKSTLGYCIDEHYQFVWVGTIPVDNQTYDLERTRDRYKNLSHTLAISQERAEELDLYRKSDRTINPNLDLTSALIRAANHLTNPLTRAFNHHHYHTLTRALNHDRHSNRDADLAYEIDLAHEIDPILNHAIHLARDLDANIYKIPEMAREVHREIAREIEIAHEIASDIYKDLFTLQERIARRSPVFEGIRLVKYREQS